MKLVSNNKTGNQLKNPTELFFNCGKCLETLDKNPKSISPEKYARLNVGLIDQSTLMVWCVRHGTPVATLPVDSSSVLDEGGFYCGGCGKFHQFGEGH